MTSSIGLYYPYIHFRDENWVKLSALYWDEMHRIVPDDDTPEDTPLVQVLRQHGGIGGGGFIKPVNPGAMGGRRSAAEVVGETFVEFIKRHKRRLQGQYSIERLEHWPDVPEEWRDRQGRRDKLAYVFYGKMSDLLRDELLRSKLARNEHYSEALGMHPRLAFIFMSSLAEHLATNLGFQPVTDDLLGHLAVKGCTHDRLLQALLPDSAQQEMPRQPQEAELILATLAIRAWAPKDLANLSATELLDIRKENTTQLTNYRAWIQSLVKSWDWLAGITDREILRERLQERYKQDMEPRIKQLESQMRRRKWVSTGAALAMTVAVPSGLTAIGNWTGVPPSAIPGTIAGISLGLSKVLADTQKAKIDQESNSAAFLVKLKSHRRPLLGAIQERARRIWVPPSTAHSASRESPTD